jgi:hypothetical protein
VGQRSGFQIRNVTARTLRSTDHAAVVLVEGEMQDPGSGQWLGYLADVDLEKRADSG